MAKYVPIAIQPGRPEDERRQVSQRLNSIGQKLAQSDHRTADMHMGGNRVTEVADPGNPTDAVNLRYLKKKLDDIGNTQQFRQKRVPYSIVFSNLGALVAGQLSAPYIMMPGKAGSPNYVLAATIPTGVGANACQLQIAQNGTNILSADLIIPAGSQGPITVTNFNAGVIFNVGDLITPVVNAAGGFAYVTIQMEVMPSGN
jgi:hypothetical protein